MSWIADAHTEWHQVNGRWGCPLDCAWSDPGMYPEDEADAHEDADLDGPAHVIE